MAGSLQPVRDRLAWARERFEQLEAACDAFVGQKPDDSTPGFGIEIDGQNGKWTLRYHQSGEVPFRLVLMAGELFYHLRGALDNLAWQLVLANNGTPGSHTEFPVFKDKGPFEQRAPAKMLGMSATAQAAIKTLQPFEAWPEHPEHTTLWKLHDLNIIDKHRLPHSACLWLAWIKGKGTIGANGRVAFTRKRGCLEDEAEVLRLEWDAGGTDPDTKMNVEFEASLDIAIHNPGQVEFVSSRKETEGSVPIGYLFEVGFDFMENVVLPAFEAEFA